jgi:enolase
MSVEGWWACPALQMGSETYQILKKLIRQKYGLSAANVGDEGGFAPPLATFEDALDLLVAAIEVNTPLMQPCVGPDGLFTPAVHISGKY